MDESSGPSENAGDDLRILVGVCTYNEAGNIQRLLEGIVTALPSADVLVVDDGSPDGTAEQVQQFANNLARPETVRCLVRDQRGLGGAIRTAMLTAIEADYDLFCNLDADFSHDPCDLPRLVEAVRRHETTDVAVGSRYIEGGKIVGWPLRRRLMSGLINRITQSFLYLPVRDASGSFRCYRVRSLAQLDLANRPTNGYGFLQEVLLRLHHRNAKIVEVPITFTERMVGESKLNLREAFRSGWTVLKLKSLKE